jgi:hypothetical protein
LFLADVAGAACRAVGDTNFTEALLQKMLWMTFIIALSLCFTHKLEAITESIAKIIPIVAKNWLALVAFAMMLLFLYYMLRPMEEALLRALLVAVGIMGACMAVLITYGLIPRIKRCLSTCSLARLFNATRFA